MGLQGHPKCLGAPLWDPGIRAGTWLVQSAPMRSRAVMQARRAEGVTPGATTAQCRGVCPGGAEGSHPA